MKLKFRAEKKDWIMFGIFALFLFYVIALLVLNAMSFIESGELCGLNPFPVFSRDYFAPTMVFYIGALIAVIGSVSSTFFEREKGIGIKASPKDEKGYSRWAKDKEIKAELKMLHPSDETTENGGIPLINNGNEVWVDNSGYHNMIIGSTGSGKSQALSFPFIRVMAKAGESMIVTDPKGELYEGTANELKERGYNIILLNFRDPQKGNCWNPFYLPYKLYKEGNIDKSTELLEDLAKNILYDESSKGNDPFWENTSADYFTGLTLALFDDAKEEEININSINLMSTVGEEKIGGKTYIQEYFSDKDQTSGAYINASSTLMAPTDTKGSILSVFKQKIKLFSSRNNLSEMLSYSDFDIEDIGRKKTAVFIVIQDEKKTYHPLVTIFLKQCYETLVRVAQETGGKLKYRTNFLMDEFANMPPLSDVDAMVSAARSRNIKLSFIIQNFSQLNDVYGKEKAETIRGNCGNTIYILSTELAALEEISKMCGEIKSKKDDKTDSRPLVTVTDLQNLKEEQAIILRSRMRPYKTQLKFDYKIDWGKDYGKADYPEREAKNVQTFNLKKYVEDKRQSKINDMLNGVGMDKKPTPPVNPMFNPAAMFGGGIPTPPNMGPAAPSGGLNVDDLVKRIDAKIAELEEEERKEKEEQEKKAKEAKKALENASETKIEKESIKTDSSEVIQKEKQLEKTESDQSIQEEKQPEKSESQPTIQEEKKPVEKIEQKKITDDQFFDDFFFDGE